MFGITRSVGDVIAEIKMTMMAFRGSFMLLEGPSDVQFWKQYIHEQKCQTISCDSRSVAISAFTDTKHGLNVSFNNSLSPWKYVDEKTWTIDSSKLLSDFATQAQTSVPDVAVSVNACPTSPEWKLIQGHDAIDILAIGM
jgi:hypothetical protein